MRGLAELNQQTLNILLCVEGLVLDGESIRLIDARLDEYVIPYEEIVLAYITSREGESVSIPEFGDITEDMEGTLVIYNRHQNCYTIEMGAVKDTAGRVFCRLAEMVPHALLGSQPWLNVYDRKQFGEVLEMVDIMKKCIDHPWPKRRT